jgi:hypothetical protein
MADVIDGAIQQAPQPGRQSKEDGKFTKNGRNWSAVSTPGWWEAASILLSGAAVLDWPYPRVYIC